MTFGSVGSLRKHGFTGFRTIAELRLASLRDVPNDTGGVYLVVRASKVRPRLLPKSLAGPVKGVPSTIDASRLRVKWIPNAPVIYIGCASGSSKKSSLRARLSTYLRNGAGSSAAHSGGRAIWQLADANSLLVCWRDEPDDAESAEDKLLCEFQRQYGRLPFANFRGCRAAT